MYAQPTKPIKWSDEYEASVSCSDEDVSYDEYEQASSGDDYFLEFYPNIFEDGTSFYSWESDGEVSDVSSAAGFILLSETDSSEDEFSSSGPEDDAEQDCAERPSKQKDKDTPNATWFYELFVDGVVTQDLTDEE